MKQKFRKFTYVHVCKEIPDSMSGFDSDFDAIIEGSYSQLCGGDDIESYMLYKLENGKIVNNLGLYEEDQLIALKAQNRDKAEELVEEYNLRD